MLELIKIGRTLKSHGKSGQIRASIDDDFLEDVENARAFFIEIYGSKVPFLLEQIEIKNHLLVKFEEVDSPEEAARLSSKQIYLSSTEVQHKSVAESPSLNQLIDYKVFDQELTFKGTVVEVQENEFQSLLLLKNENKTFWIPLHQDFVIKIDDELQQMELRLPEGLDRL